MGRGTTNPCDRASTGNAATEIATRCTGRNHDAGNACGTSANSDNRAAESNHDATELDNDATNYNDRAANPDHHQSSRAQYRACTTTQHRDASAHPDCTESDRSRARTDSADNPVGSERHGAVCDRANANAKQSTKHQ